MVSMGEWGGGGGGVGGEAWELLHFPLALCMLLLSTADFFSKNSFRNTIRVSNSLDQDQDQHFVGPDLGPICLQRLSADNKSSH